MTDSTLIWKDLRDADFERIADDLIIKYYKSTLRSVAYMIVAGLLLWENEFGVDFTWGPIAAFGLLGFSSSSARIAQFGLFVLFMMMLFPPDALRTISTAITG